MSDTPEVVTPSQRLGRAAELAFSILWIVMGIGVWYDTHNLEYIARFGPGPGFLPFWLAVGFVGFGGVLLVRTWIAPRTASELKLPVREQGRQMLFVIGSLVIFTFFAEKIGFLLGLGLMAFVLLLFVERKSWWIALLYSVLITFGLWLLFEKALTLRLPPGLLDFML